ncbi:MAG TPA: tol-pal system protein YbgF [Desulfomonilia bacterium]|nr:tol-pal system protein YbgF [Desulfomonilia bacterium]
MTLLIVSGCATQQDLNALKNQVDLLQSRLTMTETKVAENSKLTDQGLKQQGELQNRYSELQNQMFTLQGSIDQVSAAAGLTSTGGGETKISKLEKDVQSLKDLLQVKVTASGSVAAQKSLYDSGYEKFKSGLFSDAVQDFKGYLAQNPDPAIAGNAYFYMGESLYAQAKYDDAILSYDTVVKKFKDSDKVPEALYKQGLAFLKMGDKETGTLILQQLIKDHAGTEAALKAKKALKNPPSGKG